MAPLAVQMVRHRAIAPFCVAVPPCMQRLFAGRAKQERRREPSGLILLSVFVWIVVACGRPLAAEQQDALQKLPSQPTPVLSSPVTTPPTVSASPPASLQITLEDWPTYSMNSSRGGFNSSETLITAASASRLQVQWQAHTPSTISTQPIEAFGMVYWGSWDGIEHANDLTGRQIWTTGLGTTHGCGAVIGVASTATAAVIKRDDVSTPALFVGGGDGKFYALDALKGTILWATPLGSPPSHFLWSSPVVYKGSVYIGMASLADCPTVQGQLIQMDQVTGHIQHVFNVVPDDCRGGGIWTSPTIDEQTGKVYVSTGNPDPCWTGEPYASSLLELRASDLALIDSWQVPRSEWVVDSDFGSSPTLFTAAVGGVLRPLVGVAHKNGTYYAFLRDAIGSGPIWRAAIAQGGSCPDCGDGSISTAAWNGTHLYVAGGRTTINGASCYGSVRALNPTTGAALWQQCVTAGPVIAAITAVPGVVVAAAGPVLLLLDATTGQRVFTYRDPQNGGVFYGPASVSRGALYLGSTNGTLYAFGLRHLKCSCS